MKHKKILVIGVLAAVLSMLTVAIPVQGAVLQAPRIRLENGTSSNWAGYAVGYPNVSRPKAGSVSDVSGSWVVPAVTGGDVSGNTYSSVWVGIDGYASNTVEQIGTEEDWINGQAVYSAWYEMYPQYPVTISMVISPGDTITAKVEYTTTPVASNKGKGSGKGNGNGGGGKNSGSFVLTLTDITTGASYTTVQTSNSAKRSSAEWIVEAPWAGGVLPLADFGTVTFTNASFTINGTTSSNIAGLGSATYDQINMAYSDGTLKAQTSALSGGGSGFDVIWFSN